MYLLYATANVDHWCDWWSPQGPFPEKTKIQQEGGLDTENLIPNDTIPAILVVGGAPGCPFHLFFKDLQNISLVLPIDQFALSCFALVSRLSRKLDLLEK